MFDAILLFGLVVFLGSSQSRTRRRRYTQRSSTPNTSQRLESHSRAVAILNSGGLDQGHSRNFEGLSNEVASQIEKRKQIEFKLVSRRFHVAMIDPSRDDYVCNVCLDEFRIGEEVSQSVNSECLHLFHTECIVDWLVERSDRPCPVCRRDFFNE